MEKEFRMEQHYAVSETGILAHIREAHNNSEEYYCPHCGCRMMKRCGNIRAWHFAHDWRDVDEFQKKCSYETYLHGYAKLRLKQWFDESDSIILHYTQSLVCKQYDSCKLTQVNKCIRNENKSCDLKQVFNHCEIESSVKESNGSYRADLLLSSDNYPSRHILIEIKVSHGCSDKKKASDAKIIEFDVTSEEDVDYIISHDISESDKVRFYGFNLKKHDNKILPAYSLKKFILYKSGKTFCKSINCQEIASRYPSSLFELTTRISEDQCWILNLYGLQEARKRGFDSPNCYLCEHYCYTEESDCYVCKISNAAIETGADALNCDKYIFNPNVYERIKLLPLEILDIWDKKTNID